MAIEPCRECKRDVSTTADKCPHCGADYPTKAAAKGAGQALGCSCVLTLAFFGGIALLLLL